MEKERLIFHVDVNSAFLSWEAVERLKNGETLDLRTVPSCVGGDPESRRAIVSTKSIPAKKYGIVTGEAVASALRKCPELIVVQPHFSLYKRMSHAFKEILREYTPVVESFSIDEVFMDMSGMQLMYPDPIQTAHDIKDRIRDELGFTVNVGVANNKLCAKMASDFEKPDRVHTLFPDEVERKMWPLPVRELFGCGRATAEKLEHMQIRTIGDLAMTDISVLEAKFGERTGEYLYRASRGSDDSEVSAEIADAKSYGVETTTEEDLRDLTSINHLLLAQADVVGSRLRADEVKAYCITVTYRTNDFKRRSHGRKRKVSTDITEEIYEDAVKLMKEFWGGEPVRLVGISASDIDKDGFEQMSLFDEGDREKQKRLDRALDEIRNRYGNDSVVRAGVGAFRAERKD
ncbi:MAG: DNA polymerase IV [Lachnospiraceae bacterium]|nr:DNA polymerase IV [Lachnospiraceae bacterium]